MATVSAAVVTTIVARAAIARPNALGTYAGLPALRARSERVRCSYAKDAAPVSTKGAGASLLAAAGAVTASAGPALALVDERMSTEGTGLSLGLSNNLLGWILLGVFGLIWSLYTIYTSDLDEDEESGGLSL
uniref:PSII 6.1 kDa protein n=1 Tax=Zea mays TaxID=4577 RepID=B6T2W4_MAIZE|nr:photosystem II reaction center W protein [Zea mays]